MTKGPTLGPQTVLQEDVSLLHDTTGGGFNYTPNVSVLSSNSHEAMWDDSRLVPAYFAAASLAVLAINSVLLSKPFKNLVTRLSPAQELPANVTSVDDTPVPRTIGKFQNHVSNHGGPIIFGYNLARLIGCLSYLAVEFATLILEQQSNSGAPVSHPTPYNPSRLNIGLCLTAVCKLSVILCGSGLLVLSDILCYLGHFIGIGQASLESALFEAFGFRSSYYFWRICLSRRLAVCYTGRIPPG